MKKNSAKTRLVTGFIAVALVLGWVQIGGNYISRAARHSIQNPISISDVSMRSGKRVTYDTVFLGSYPQTEVKSSDPVYSKLQAATNWDICGDTVVEGTKYRRIKQSDAVGCTMDLEIWHYDEENDDYYSETVEPGIGADGYSHWEDYDTYHYFRFDPIRWRVLDTDGEKALLLSDIAIDARATDIYMWTRPADPEDVLTIDGVRYQCIDSTWDNCELRSWLNSYDASHNYYKVNCSGSGEKSFYNVAFSNSEKSAILTTSLNNEGGRTAWHNGNTYEYTVGGRDTEDKVFLLSYDDVIRKYGFSASDDVADEARRCNLSDYTISMGLYGEADDGNISRDKWSVQWGLRTATDGVSFHYGSDHYGSVEKTGKRYIYRNRDGSVYNYGDWVGRFQGVRPAMMLDLSSSAYSYAGTVCTDGTYSDGTQYSLGNCETSHMLRHVDAVEATYESAGHQEYWICDRCGKVFADKNGQIETTLFELAIPRLTENTHAPVTSQTPVVAPTEKPNETPMPVPTTKPSATPMSTVKPIATVKPSETPKTTPSVKPSATPSSKPSVSPSASPDNTSEEESSQIPQASDKPIESFELNRICSSGVTYEINGLNACVQKVKNTKNVTIKKTIKQGGKKYKVTKLRKGLFARKKKVKRITIDVTYIKSIGRHAFDGIAKNAEIKLIGSKKRIMDVRVLIVRSGLPNGVKLKS